MSTNSKEYTNQYRLEHLDKIHENEKRYREKIDKKVLRRKMAKNWYKTHKKERKEYLKQRRKIDPQFRLNKNITVAIWEALKEKKAGRKWEDLVGYSLQELVKHIEKQFEPWMSWDNYGKWHIDHIKPQSLFNYVYPEDLEFKKCWALKNLQPLEAKKNMRKSNIYK